jgi:hypothetical protein
MGIIAVMWTLPRDQQDIKPSASELPRRAAPAPASLQLCSLVSFHYDFATTV